jgi:polyhydroxyalkanoate synthase
MTGQERPLHKELIAIPRPTGGRLMATRKRSSDTPRATLMLVHGFAQNRYTFHLPGHSFTDFLAREAIDTWNVELQGFGRSGTSSPLARTFDELVDESFLVALRFIAKQAGRPVFVLGHSLGGILLHASVPAAHDRVAGAITLAATHRMAAMEPLFASGARLLAALGGLSSGVVVPVPAMAALLSRMPHVLDSRAVRSLPSFYFPGTIAREPLRFWLRHGFEPGLLGPHAQVARAFAHPRGAIESVDRSLDYSRRWEGMSPVPLLSFGADKDPYVPLGAVRNAFEANRGTDKTFVTLRRERGGDHWGHGDVIHGQRAPKEVWTRVRDWILARS